MEFDEQVKKRLGQLQELQEMLNETEADDGETRRELEEEVLRLRGELETMSRESGKPTLKLREAIQNALIAGMWAVFVRFMCLQ